MTFNLCIDRTDLYFCQVNYDGTDLKKITEEVPGSGHPTVHANRKQIVADACPWDPTFTRVAFNGYADGTHRVYVADLSEAGILSSR